MKKPHAQENKPIARNIRWIIMFFIRTTGTGLGINNFLVLPRYFAQAFIWVKTKLTNTKGVTGFIRLR